MQKFSRKTVVIGGIIVIAVLAIASKGMPTSSMNTSQDILSSDRDYRAPTHFIYDSSKLPSIGASETDVYNSLGKDVDRRLSFKITRQKTVNGTSFEYNKLLNYTETFYKTTKRTEGGDLITDSVPLEMSEVVVYLLDGKVTYFAGFHGKRESSDADYMPTSDSVNLDEQNKAWPDSESDLKQWYAENGKEWK